jgi:P pilus assembly chaperone PapD
MHRFTKLAVLAAALAATPLAASARSTYLSAFNTKYKTSGTVLDSCSTCHGSGGTSTFNPYGQELRNNIASGITTALDVADPKDSDGDGYSNGAEAAALTFPGDPKSFPAPAPTPAPAIAVSPASLAFGTVDVGASGSANLTVSNGGTATLNVTAVSRCGGTSTEFSAAPTSFSVAAGGRTTVVVTYAPTAAGADSGCLALANNSSTPNVQVNVSGTGQAVVAAAPRIAVSATSLAFGTVTVGSSANQTTIVSNAGDADLVGSSVARCSGTSTEFTASPASFTVAPGGSQTVTVAYAPVDATTDAGCVAIANNDATTGTVNVSVSGTGQSQPNPVVDVDITRFSVAKRLDISRGGVATPKAALVNAGTAAGTVTVHLEGTAPDALGVPAVVYTASQDVTLAAGASTKVGFPAFAATTPEIVTWTLTVVDQNPDTDVATATTKIVP